MDKKFNFKDGTQCYLVFECGLHHSIYFDLQSCLFHYDYLIKYRDKSTTFEIYELIFDSDMQSFKPNGIVCTMFHNHKLKCRFPSDFERIKKISNLFSIELEDSNLVIPFIDNVEEEIYNYF